MRPDQAGIKEFRELMQKIEAYMCNELRGPILEIYLLESLPRLDSKRKANILFLLNKLGLLLTHSYDEEMPWGHVSRSDTPINLAKTDFTNANLQGLDFWNQRLCEDTEGADGHWEVAPNFTEVDFSKAKFCGSNLRNAIIRRAILKEAQFQKSNLSYADLREAQIENTDFGDAILKGATMENLDLRGAILTGSNLSQANLQMSDLSNVNLNKCDLSGANLVGATLIGVDLRNVIIENANFELANLTDAKVTSKQFEIEKSLNKATAFPSVVDETSFETSSSQVQTNPPEG